MHKTRTIGEVVVRPPKCCTHIFVIHQLHQLELPVRALRVCDILKWSRQLFDGHILFGDCIIRSTAVLLGGGSSGGGGQWRSGRERMRRAKFIPLITSVGVVHRRPPDRTLFMCGRAGSSATGRCFAGARHRRS